MASAHRRRRKHWKEGGVGIHSLLPHLLPRLLSDPFQLTPSPPPNHRTSRVQGEEMGPTSFEPTRLRKVGVREDAGREDAGREDALS